jgi:hypothetical protein
MRHLNRSPGDRRSRLSPLLLVLLAATLPAIAFAADTPKKEAAKAPAGDTLVEKLLAAVNSPINVDLKTGQQFVRATLVRVNTDAKKTKVVSLAIQEPSSEKARIVAFVSIQSIRIDREEVYEAPVTGAKTAIEKRMQKEAAKAAEDRAQWVARAKKNKVTPWPELTQEQHDAAEAVLRSLIDDVSKSMPSLKVHETAEFLFCSNIPDDQIAPYTKALDNMHDMMCEMYGIKKGEPVWKGKCLVMAFLDKSEFLSFEKVFLKNPDVPAQVYGLCHSYSDGKVIMACYRGDDPKEFAKMLVHETSHGFIHRYRTPARLPTWINEGMADWIAQTLVPQDTTVKRRQQEAITRLYQTHNMGEKFLTTNDFIEPWQYGTASSLTDFLIRNNKQAYTRFIQGIKEGAKWEQSLQTAFKITPDQLVASYGKAIGVPDLK